MANPISLPGDLIVPGTLRLTGSISPTKDKSDVLAVAEDSVFTIPWTLWRTWDSLGTNLPSAAAADDLGLVGGTFGSASPSIQGLDFGGGSTTAYARAQIPLPWNYVASGDVTLRFHAGMLTTIADDYCKLDVECYETDEETGISADICYTAEQSINSLVLADIDFVITDTALVAGDLLDVRIKVTGNDVGDAGVMTPVIGAVQLLCDVR